MLDAFPSGCPSPARIKEERSYHSNSISFLTNRKVVNANRPISPPFVFVSFSASRIKGKEILFFFFLSIDYTIILVIMGWVAFQFALLGIYFSNKTEVYHRFELYFLFIRRSN